MKKIALINDLSGFGKCSLTAAIPVISAMGIQACPLPTAVLSAQTGFSNYYCDDYTDRMDCFIREWKNMQLSFDGISSGFLASPEQIRKVAFFLEQFQSPDTKYFLDPVMGDNGHTAKNFSKELLEGMKSLTKTADIITPNLTELCLLTGKSFEDLVSYREKADYTERIREVCLDIIKKSDHSPYIVVTGIIRMKKEQEYMGNLIVSEKETVLIEKPYIKQSFSGTGDLFAAVVCGLTIKGMEVKDSVQKAVDFLYDAIFEAADQKLDSRHGVPFEKYLSHLLVKENER